MEKFSLLVWSEPHPGQEDVYNDWYDNIHLGEVCALPGITGGQRYVFSGLTETPRKYLAFYDIETNEPEGFFERFSAQLPHLQKSPAIDLGSIIVSMVRKV